MIEGNYKKRENNELAPKSVHFSNAVWLQQSF